MKIGIDAHILGKNKGGVEVYLNNVVRCLQAIDSRNEYIFYVNNGFSSEDVVSKDKRFCFKPLMFSSPWLRRSLSLPMAVKRDGIDVLHVQRTLSLGFPPSRSVVSIYDIAQELYPEFFDTKDGLIVRRLIKSSAMRAKRIITCSYTSKKDLVDHYGISQEKIAVAYPAVDDIEEISIDEDWAGTFLKEQNIRSPFLLFIGALEPRKNVQGVIDIMAMLKAQYKFDGSMVILGGAREGIKKSYYPMLKAKVKELGLTDSVIFLGYQGEKVKQMLLKKASALIYPSFYEGFGIPILEAFRFGLPVVLSEIPVFKEIADGCVLFADPQKSETFVSHCNRILSDKVYAGNLSDKGRVRLKDFTWTEAAKKHLEVYEAV